MFCNFKKSILLQRRHILFAVSFCTLFSLLFSSVLFAAVDEEFTKLENQLKEKTLNPDEFIKSSIQTSVQSYSYETRVYGVNDALLKRRNELIRLGQMLINF